MSTPNMTFSRFPLALTLACLPVLAQVSPTINVLPSREFGHTKLTFGVQTAAPNLVEGRELSGPLRSLLISVPALPSFMSPIPPTTGSWLGAILPI